MRARVASTTQMPEPESSGVRPRCITHGASIARNTGEENLDTVVRAVSNRLTANGDRPGPSPRSSRPMVADAAGSLRSCPKSPNTSAAYGANESIRSTKAAPSPGASRSASSTIASIVRGITAVRPSGKDTPVGRSVLR